MMDLATRKMFYYGLIGVLIAGSTIAVFQISPVQILPKDGTLNVYLSGIQTDIPGNQLIPFSPLQTPVSQTLQTPSVKLVSLNVTIDSITIHMNGNSSDAKKTLGTKFTFDVLKSFNVTKLLVSAQVPSENVTMVDLHVAHAEASVQGQGVQPVKVPSNELKIPLSPAVHIKAQMSSSIVISGTAHIVIEGNGDIILTPVLHVDRTSGPR